jgi:hypothetical protein
MRKPSARPSIVHVLRVAVATSEKPSSCTAGATNVSRSDIEKNDEMRCLLKKAQRQAHYCAHMLRVAVVTSEKASSCSAQ